MSNKPNPDFNFTRPELISLITDILHDPKLWDDLIQIAPQLMTIISNALARRMATQSTPAPDHQTVASTDHHPDTSETNTPKPKISHRKYGTVTIDEYRQKSDMALRMAYSYCKNQYHRIPENMRVVLAERFPGYDPKADVFNKPKTIEQYRKMNNSTLRSTYAFQKKHSGVIPDNLRVVLAERFPGYDPKADVFRKPKTIEHYQKMTDSTLRSTYAFQKKHSGVIPDNLRVVLAERFPGYDATRDCFVGKYNLVQSEPDETMANSPTPAAPENSKPDAASRSLPLFRIDKANGTYSLFFKYASGQRKNIAYGAIEPFELALFDQRSNIAIIRKVPEIGNPRFLIINCKSGNVPKGLPRWMSEIKYNPVSHELFCDSFNSDKYTWHLALGTNAIQIINVPAGLQTINAAKSIRETVVITHDGTIIPQEPFIFTPEDKTQTPRSIRVVPDMPAASTVPQITNIVPDKSSPIKSDDKNAVPQKVSDQTTKTHVLSVTVKQVKMTLDGTYNDVFVNGNLILKNHLNTRIATFMDGTILGVYGIVTTDSKLPTRPLWQIYDPDLRARTFGRPMMYSQTHTYICDVMENTDNLRLMLSNRSSILLNSSKVHALARGRIFDIANTQYQMEK